MIHGALIFFFAFCIIVTCVLNRAVGFDKSIGETKPKFKDKATYPKFYVHWVTAVTITWFMWITGLSFIDITALMIVAIPFYEWSQKFFNKWDMLAGAIGVLTSFLVIYVLS